MKEILKVYSKYLLLILSIFLLFFVSILIYNLIPLFKISMNLKEMQTLIRQIAIPAFYHSLFNSLVLSLFLYGVTVLNFYHKNRVINFLLPIITSSLIIVLIILLLKPGINNLYFLNLNDARLYLPQDTFIENKEYKLYFHSISKNEINNLILIENKNVSFYKKGLIKFQGESIFIEINEQNNRIETIELPKDQFNTFDIEGTYLNKTFFTLLKETSYKFVYTKDIFVNTLLWLGLAIFILSLTSIVRIKNNPFLSLIFNLLFIILFYYSFNYTFELYNKIGREVFSTPLIKDLFFGISIIFIAFILQLINFIFFRRDESEE